MSNYLAVATVTAALHAILSDAVADVSGARVVLERPRKEDADAAAPRVSLFLYHALPHAAWRPTDLREQVALDLQYLITFSGDDKRYEPQLLLALVVRTLHEEPVLTGPRIAQVEASAPFLSFPDAMTSDLAQQDEPVKFTPLPLTADDLAKLWPAFFGAAYGLSLAYQAGPVYLDRRAGAAGP